MRRRARREPQRSWDKLGFDSHPSQPLLASEDRGSSVHRCTPVGPPLIEKATLCGDGRIRSASSSRSSVDRTCPAERLTTDENAGATEPRRLPNELET